MSAAGIKAKLISAVKRAPHTLTPELLFQSAGITEAAGRDALSQLVDLGEIVVGREWLLYVPTSTDRAIREIEGLLAQDQAAATRQQVSDRLHDAKSAREVEQWKALKLIADLANATLRQWRMTPRDLDESIRTIRRTAELATRRDLGARARRPSKKSRPR